MPVRDAYGTRERARAPVFPRRVLQGDARTVAERVAPAHIFFGHGVGVENAAFEYGGGSVHKLDTNFDTSNKCPVVHTPRSTSYSWVRV